MRASFQHREIVWGKIDPYPWWPGKIISMHIQSEEIIYKILFFADPTYAYLQQSQLRSFQAFDRDVNTHFPRNARLNKAIRMADQYYGKVKASDVSQEGEIEINCRIKAMAKAKKQQIRNINQADHIISQEHLSLHSQAQDDRHEEADQSRQKIDRIRSQQTMVNMNTERQCYEQEKVKQIDETFITVGNIIDVLENRMRGEQSFEYNYQNRKNAIRQKIELKQKLLEKYNLHKLVNLSVSSTQNDKDFKSQKGQILYNRKRRHNIKRSKICREKNEKDISELQDKCLKKIYKSARKALKSKIDNSRLKLISINSIKKITELSQNHPNLFRNMYMNLIRFIERLNLCQVEQIDDMMTNFNGFFDRLENDKNEQEEGSKMTQVSIAYC